MSANGQNTLGGAGANASTINGGSQAIVAIGGTSQLTSTGNVTISATSTATATAGAIAPAAGGNPAADADLAQTTLNSTALAHVSDTSSLSVGGILGISATNNGTVTTTADGSQGGAGTAGGSLAITHFTGNTQAYIDSSVAVIAGAINISATSMHNVTTTATATAGGASSNNDNIQTLAENLAKTSDGNVTVAGALAVTDLKNTTQAYISSGGKISSTGAISINTSAANSSSTVANGSATGSQATGVGAAVAVNVVNATNQASVGNQRQTPGQVADDSGAYA